MWGSERRGNAPGREEVRGKDCGTERRTNVLMVKRTLLTEWSWKKAKEGRSCLQTGHLDE
jgi:hypothetical protein